MLYRNVVYNISLETLTEINVSELKTWNSTIMLHFLNLLQNWLFSVYCAHFLFIYNQRDKGRATPLTCHIVCKKHAYKSNTHKIMCKKLFYILIECCRIYP